MVGLQRRNVENKCAKVVDEMHVILKCKNIKEKRKNLQNSVLVRHGGCCNEYKAQVYMTVTLAGVRTACLLTISHAIL